MHPRIQWLCLQVLLILTVDTQAESTEPELATWADTATKAKITDFVERVTDAGSPDYVPPAERIAVFDNDGTLWVEKPTYIQLAFALDRVKTLAGEHPEWQEQQPFKAALEGDMKSLATTGKKGVLQLVMATHAGMTCDEFAEIVAEWLKTAKHPQYQRPYTECVYEPMLELLEYLRAKDFNTYIVSAGGVEFMRVFAEKVYGIPPEQTFGSSIRLKYEVRDNRTVLVRLPEIDFIDDKAGKPVGIQHFIGRRPIMAFGNSDGDFEMLEFATKSDRPGMGVLIHHTDAEREAAYDRNSAEGRLYRGLDEVSKRDWILVDMKEDWLQIFPD